MSELKLASCPFCGCEAVMQVSKRWPDGAEQAVDGYTVVCLNLGCIMCSDEWWCDTEAEAAEAWNARAERTCRFVDDSDGEFPPKCSACGYEPSIYECSWLCDGGYEFEGNYCPECGARVEGEN